MYKVKLIKFLKQIDIDKAKWDNCIDNSTNSIIYAYSWYLDIVSPKWNAIVLGDYEAVMPLPSKSKLFIKYVYQPYFAQQLGVFSTSDIIDTSLFISAIPKVYKMVELNLNEKNNCTENILRNNANYKLNIARPYEDIAKAYNRNCRRNLKKAKQFEFNVSMDLQAAEFADFVKANLEEQIQGVGASAYNVLEQVVQKSLERGKADLVGLYDSNKQLHAAGFFLKNKDRYIFSVCASTDFGKRNQAMYLLVDSQIKKNAENYVWYDFSGSNIKGISYFNSTFGAVESSYKTILINRLPNWVRALRL